MLEWIAKINDYVNDFVWVTIGIWLLVGTGILMTVLTRFFQVSHIGHWFKQTIGSVFKKNVSGHVADKGTVSQFQALCTALAATVGVGNIAGVASAITLGGAGAVFWMWVAAFFGMMTNYSENVLGIYYRRKNRDGEWSGGAMYYLRDGLGGYKGFKTVGKILAYFFAFCAVLASFGIGNMSQINTIITNFTSAFKIPALSNVVLYGNPTDGSAVNLYMIILAIVIMTIGGLVVIGGLKRIASFAEKVVPFMVVLYIIGALIIVGVNYKAVGNAFSAIFSTAFKPLAVWGGVNGIAIKTVVTWGFKRGCFSNEAGLGSSVMVHANSNVTEPVKQGMWGIFEVFADTIVICTLTALVILTSGVIDLNTGNVATGVAGTTLVAEAFKSVIPYGDKFVAIAIFLFAFTTVLGWSYYGTKTVEFLGGDKAKAVYKFVFVAAMILGALLTNSLAWDISDTFNGMMMLPNLIGVIALSPLVVSITSNYVARKLKGKKIKPILSFDPIIQQESEQNPVE